MNHSRCWANEAGKTNTSSWLIKATPVHCAIKQLTLPGVNARGFLVQRHTLKLPIRSADAHGGSLAAVFKPDTRSIEPLHRA
jgi:hypothetical protein